MSLHHAFDWIRPPALSTGAIGSTKQRGGCDMLDLEPTGVAACVGLRPITPAAPSQPISLRGPAQSRGEGARGSQLHEQQADLEAPPGDLDEELGDRDAPKQHGRPGQEGR